MALRPNDDAKKSLCRHQQMNSAKPKGDDKCSPRQPLGAKDPYIPYTSEQFETLKAVFNRVAGSDCFERYWPQIKSAAEICTRNLDWLRRCKKDSVIWRPLERAVERGDISKLLDNKPDEAEALLHGAMLANVISVYPGDDYSAEYDQLRRLDRTGLMAALKAAKAKGSVLYNKGRPSGGPIKQFAAFLGEIYKEATGKPLSSSYYNHKTNERTGPAIEILQAGLSPFYRNRTTHGIRKLIEQIRTQGRRTY